MPVSRPDVRIRPMLAADVPAAAQVIIDGGWGDRSVFLGWAVAHETCYPVVADDGDRVVGTGIATVNGRVGWVGTIFVATDRRRSGLGSALTEAVVDELERRGCTTQLLIATDEGRPIYERLGFAVQARYVRQAAPEGPAPADDGRVRSYRDDDFDAIAALDRMATGEDRSAILRAFAEPSTSRVTVGDDGAVGGFIVRAPWGGRALVASDPEHAVALLDWRRRGSSDRQIVIAVLEANAAGRARLADAGWTEAPGGPRMFRGAAIEWRPEWIYGQFNGALG
jgi:GNAT superfamily N-acetyltransferase